VLEEDQPAPGAGTPHGAAETAYGPSGAPAQARPAPLDAGVGGSLDSELEAELAAELHAGTRRSTRR